MKGHYNKSRSDTQVKVMRPRWVDSLVKDDASTTRRFKKGIVRHSKREDGLENRFLFSTFRGSLYGNATVERVGVSLVMRLTSGLGPMKFS